MSAAPARLRTTVACGLGVLLLSAPAARAAPADSTLVIEQLSLRTRHGTPIAAEAGRLLVPENRSVPASRRIPVSFLRLHSSAAAPRAPLFYLAGGPGDQAVTRDPGALEFWTPILAVCDVVLIDQRGVNDPALRWSWDGPPPLAFFLSADSAARHITEMERRAGEAFRARGVDITGYTTVASAADLDDLRTALGLPRVSLLAFSYGTHLASAYLRAYGDRVESAVMLGTEGPDQTYKPPANMDSAMVRLGRFAAAEPDIGRRVPDLMALYDHVIERLSREPMRVPVPAPGGRDTLQVPVGPFGLRWILRADVGDATDLPVFPRLLWSIERGDPSVLAWFVRKRARGVLGVHGMNSAMDAASGASPARRALIAEQSRTSRFADVVNFPYSLVEDAWGVPDLGPAFRAPVTSRVRTLFVSGSLDFNTPPAQAEEMASRFSHATCLVVENAGHEQTFWQNDTAMPVVVDFLAGKDVRGRRITYPPLRFVPLEGTGAVRHPSVER
jgi:pimeloyl-ACP methyl ester carboxylesterase